MKNIAQKVMFSILFCSICLCTYGSNSTHGAEALFTQLLNELNNYDNENVGHSQGQPNDTAVNMNITDTLAVNDDSTSIVDNVNTSEKGTLTGKMSMFDWISILALIISAYVLYKSKKADKEIQALLDLNDEAKKLNGEIDGLKEQMAKIRQSINKKYLAPEDSSQKVIPSQGKQQEQKPIVCESKQPVETARYATIIKGEKFLEMGIKDTADEFTVCILTLTGKYGTFVVNNSPAAQQNILSKFNYGLSNITVVKNKNLSPSNIKTIKPGKIIKVGKDWLVTEKAEIELC